MAIDTILIAVGPNDADRTDSLAGTVIDIAGPTGADVVLAHVFTEEEYDTALERLDFPDDADVAPDTVADRHRTVQTLRTAIRDAGIHTSVRGSVGEHGDEIVALADEIGADLAIVGGRKRSPTGKAVFGSVAQNVMLNAPCPVTFVRGVA